jgi:hypothetical protein
MKLALGLLLCLGALHAQIAVRAAKLYTMAGTEKSSALVPPPASPFPPAIACSKPRSRRPASSTPIPWSD